MGQKVSSSKEKTLFAVNAVDEKIEEKLSLAREAIDHLFERNLFIKLSVIKSRRFIFLILTGDIFAVSCFQKIFAAKMEELEIQDQNFSKF